MNDPKKAVVFLLMLLFAFSSFPPTIAVPSSRSIKKWITNENITTQQLYHGRIQNKERMDLELQDYPGAGSNPRHDPAPPRKF